MLLLIKSLETAEPSGKSKVRMFRRNFTFNLHCHFNLHYRAPRRSLEMRGKGDTHDRWAGLPGARRPLCLKRKRSRLASGRPGTAAPHRPRAAAPIEDAGAARGSRYTRRCWLTPRHLSTGSRCYPRFPPDTLLGQAVGPR
jgi:hypothetical protein